jgi:hypothetical protein
MTPNQLGIIDHTLHRASVPGLFCGNSPDMQALVRLGYMASAGRVSWVPDEYFRITAAGRQAWQDWKDAQPKPPPISRRKARSKQRYLEWLRSGAADGGISFGQWLQRR